MITVILLILFSPVRSVITMLAFEKTNFVAENNCIPVVLFITSKFNAKMFLNECISGGKMQLDASV